MLWACFSLPQLPLEAVFGAIADATPRAIFDGPANRPLILLPNAAAQALGVAPGMSLAAARVHAPQLEAARRQPKAEHECLRHLAAWAYGFSSQVACEGLLPWERRQPRGSVPLRRTAADPLPGDIPRHSVLLEVGASLGLFGGWPILERQLREGLAELGHRHHLVAAPSPAGAELLAAAGHDFAVLAEPQLRNALAALPLDRCGLPPRLLDALKAVGWRRLEPVLRAPRAELARRFEPALPAWLDRLLGAVPDPRPLYRPPDRFERTIEFDLPLESLEALAFPLRRLCTELAAFLIARDGGVQQLTLVIGHDDVPATRVEVGLRIAQREAAPLLDAVRGRLERTPLPGPVRALGLDAAQLPPFVPERRSLFDPAPRGELDWPALQERLRARLGDEAVRGLRLHADHRPECAWRSDAPGGDADIQPPAAPRPLWLLPRPQPLRQAVVQRLSDPERIESGWWDDADVRRDYVIAELADGQRAWLYREAGSNGPWMLHGWFA